VNAVLVAGGIVGLGVWLIVAGVWPAREPLALVLGRIGSARPAPVDRSNLDARFGARARRFGPIEQAMAGLAADLRLLHKDPDEQAGQLVGVTLVGLAWGPAVFALLALGGVRLPLVVPVWGALIGAAAVALSQLASITGQAARRRADFSFSLSAFLDVLSTGLAAGQTVKAAVDYAAAAGDGWAFEDIRVAVTAGYIDGRHPWEALGDLARDTRLDELAELAAALQLAGEEGTAVRAIVRAKARVIRDRIAAQLEQRGSEATERMALPAILLAIAFFLFWGYPAYVTLASAN
jgi:Flp pilus assembly protein TadB